MSVQDNLDNLLSNISDSYQKTVGFPTYDILKSVAVSMDQLHTLVDSAKSLLDIDNLTGEELDRFVKQRKGIYRRSATNATAILTVVGNGTIRKGDLFETSGGIQFICNSETIVTDSGTIAVTAVQAGSSGNVPAEAIAHIPITIAGIISVTNAALSDGGYDEEDDDSLRQRYYEAIRRPATSGNIYHYIAWAKEVPGVGAVKVFPLAQGNNTVDVVIVDSYMSPADSSLIKSVQDYIDPSSSGEGRGQAPIGAHCYVSTVDAVSIAVTADIKLSNGFTIEAVKENIKKHINAYLSSIAFNQDYVSVGKIISCINDTEGVLDYSNFTVNGALNNIQIGERQVATLGEVTINAI